MTNININKKYICEYIWIGGQGEIRSKTRVLNIDIDNDNEYIFLNRIPEWNYDGSSTEQAPSDGNTEVILKPCIYFKNPLTKLHNSFLVLCDTYDTNNNPLPTNHRYNAKKIFDMKLDDEPWFGLEQEYFIIFDHQQLGAHFINNNLHYCGNVNNQFERQIVNKHLEKCVEIGLDISGINSEVSSYQWEFQIGPSIGINAADELIIARFLLERIAEEFDARICYHPKPHLNINGSGCHINFSTKQMRTFPNGLKIIQDCMAKLERKHKEHINVYGNDNKYRLTGKHETSDINIFNYGIGTRNTSVRIPNQTVKDKCGYFEDRRPAANIDPYQATSIIFKTCCLDISFE